LATVSYQVGRDERQVSETRRATPGRASADRSGPRRQDIRVAARVIARPRCLQASM